MSRPTARKRRLPETPNHRGHAASEPRPPHDRANLLADVAEMYYLQDKNQAEIARVVGVTRSMVSRMLSEARQKGIVEIAIRRPLQPDRELEEALVKRFGLRSAHVVTIHSPEDAHLLQHLGNAGAQALRRYLSPGTVLGLAWGTSISATIDAVEVEAPLPIKIVQMVGALGARNNEYDGHGLVMRLAERLGGEGYYLNAPFICPSREIAHSLMDTEGIAETIRLAKKAKIALLGVGSIAPKYSSFYLAGYVPLEELVRLREAGAVGDVCGRHFDVHGRECHDDLSERLVAIQREDLLGIPVRIGVAGGPGKVEPVLGALRGEYINVLVTDSITARRVLETAQTPPAGP